MNWTPICSTALAAILSLFRRRVNHTIRTSSASSSTLIQRFPLGLRAVLNKWTAYLCQENGYRIWYVFLTEEGYQPLFVKVPAFPKVIDDYIERKKHVSM